MANSSISGLTALAGALADADLIEIVDDPGGTPLSRSATLTQVGTNVAAQLVSSATFTPTLTTTGTDFDSVTLDPAAGGRYIRIDDLVHFQLVMSTDAVTIGSATGNVIIGGLPITSVASSGATADGNSAVAIAVSAGWAGENPIAARVSANDTTIALRFRATVTGGDAPTVVADVATGANANNITISGTYVAA